MMALLYGTVPAFEDVEENHQSIPATPGPVYSLSDATLSIVLQRIGDPNVLPFIHVTLVSLLNTSGYPAAIGLLQADFTWNKVIILPLPTALQCLVLFRSIMCTDL